MCSQRSLIPDLTLVPFCASRGSQKAPPRSCAATSGEAQRRASLWRCGVGSHARAAGSPRMGAPTATAPTARACSLPHCGPPHPPWSSSHSARGRAGKISSWVFRPDVWDPLSLPSSIPLPHVSCLGPIFLSRTPGCWFSSLLFIFMPLPPSTCTLSHSRGEGSKGKCDSKIL